MTRSLILFLISFPLLNFAIARVGIQARQRHGEGALSRYFSEEDVADDDGAVAIKLRIKEVHVQSLWSALKSKLQSKKHYDDQDGDDLEESDDSEKHRQVRDRYKDKYSEGEEEDNFDEDDEDAVDIPDKATESDDDDDEPRLVPLKLHSGSRGRREEVDPDQEEGDESVFDDDDDVKTSPSVKVVVLIVCGVVLVIGIFAALVAGRAVDDYQVFPDKPSTPRRIFSPRKHLRVRQWRNDDESEDDEGASTEEDLLSEADLFTKSAGSRDPQDMSGSDIAPVQTASRQVSHAESSRSATVDKVLETSEAFRFSTLFLLGLRKGSSLKMGHNAAGQYHQPSDTLPRVRSLPSCLFMAKHPPPQWSNSSGRRGLLIRKGLHQAVHQNIENAKDRYTTLF